MTEHRRKAFERPAAERYYADYVRVTAGNNGDSVQRALQEAINEGTRQSWKLVSVVGVPGGEGFLVVWDTSGFFSG